MEEYLKALEGITYSEWIRLRTGIDRTFEQQKGEFEKHLKLANSDLPMNIIRSQFGRTWD